MTLTYVTRPQYDWYDMFDFRDVSEWSKESWLNRPFAPEAILLEQAFDLVCDKVGHIEFPLKIEFPTTITGTAPIEP